ncbi:hypothetical protein K439DRAFT_1643451 [Ramaria rubella]|nr:hypothetical protein K439DRAFT_1643451 [Ramaria rubella]
MFTTPLRPFGRKEPPAPLPGSKHEYETPLKRELASRLLLVCSAFLAFTWLVLLFTTMDFSKGPPLGVFGHLITTSLVAVTALGVGAAPLLVLRGRAVSEKYTPYLTRAEAFVTLLFSAQVCRSLAYFAVSGFSLAVLHVAFLNLSEWEDSRLSILSPTRRNAFRLNERFFYLAFFNASLGLVFASRDLIRQRQVVRWPRFDGKHEMLSPAPTSKALETFLALLNAKAVTSTTIITFIHIIAYPVWYHALRALLLPSLRNLPVISGLTRPLLHAFGRTWTVDVPWFRMLTLGFKTSLGWEIVETAFDHWVAQPIAISHKVPNPNEAIVSGLHSQDRYFKQHAYIELSAIACSSSAVASARRTDLFTNQKTNPTFWNATVREILITLGRDYQSLLRRGKPAPPTLAPASIPSTPKTPRQPSTPLIRQAILKPSPRSFFDSLDSDGAATQALSSIASLSESVTVPSVFLPSTPVTPRQAKEVIQAVEVKPTEVVKKVESKMILAIQTIRAGRKAIVLGLLGWGEGMLPQEWKVREWWTDVSVERQARACIPEGALDTTGIHALSRLIAASLKEDTLGTVQRDIPRVLEAFLSFLSAAEEYHAELESKISQQNANVDFAIARDVAHAIEVVLPVVHALQEGVGLIAKTFGDRLSVYKFPAATARRLQSFMDCL